MSSGVRSKTAIDAARAYVALGWPVLPIHAGRKIPATEHGHKSATTNPNQLEALWPTGSTHGVAVAPGDASRIVVLDIDPKNGGDESLARLVDQIGALPPTVTAITGSGGAHIYFQRPRDLQVERKVGFMPGIDWIGGNGCVIAAPSLHESGRRYEWKAGHAPGEIELAPVPAGLLELLAPSMSSGTSERPAMPPTRAVSWEGAAELLERARSYAERVPPAHQGTRNNSAFQLAGHLRALANEQGEALSEADLEIVMQEWASRCVPPMEPAEVRTCVSNSGKHGTLPPSKPSRRSSRSSTSDSSELRGEYALTDTGNADRFVERFTGKLLYCVERKTWCEWQGGRWRIGKDAALHRSKEIAGAILLDAARKSAGADRDQMTSWAKKSESAERRSAIVKLASAEPALRVAVAELDRDPMLLNCPNGTVELDTGRLRPPQPEDRITKRCPTRYVPDAECPVWLRTLERVLPDDEQRAYFQRFCGLALTGDVSEQAILIAYGDGANGKSTVFTAIQKVLSTAYAIQISSDLLIAKKQRGHPTELTDLCGARLAIGTELSREQLLDEALVKQLTGGEPIRARGMHENFWEFEPTHKLVIVTNHLPKVRGTEHAIWRRLHFLPFEVTIQPAERDRSLAAKLASEREGILAWMVYGLQQWRCTGLKPPDGVLRQPEGKLLTSAEMFVLAHVFRAPGRRVAAAELFQQYAQYCERERSSQLSQKSLGQALGAAGYGSKKSNGRSVYDDLALNLGDASSAPAATASGRVGTMGIDFCIDQLGCPRGGTNAETVPNPPHPPCSPVQGSVGGVRDPWADYRQYDDLGGAA